MKKILVVDDESIMLLRIKKILEGDYAVSLIKNGRDAISYIHDIGAPDLLIMDIEMPQLNGLEAVRILRNEGYNMAVLFLSGVEDDDVKSQCAIFGNSNFIQKPGEAEDIMAMVKSMLRDFC